MARKLVILLAFLAAFGQALASASFSRMTSADELAHALSHAQEDAHHHHDDGNLHVDQALEEGSFHVHLDGANPAALPAALAGDPAPALPQGPPGWEPRAHASPTIDGLLRPPKLAAFPAKLASISLSV